MDRIFVVGNPHVLSFMLRQVVTMDCSHLVQAKLKSADKCICISFCEMIVFVFMM